MANVTPSNNDPQLIVQGRQDDARAQRIQQGVIADETPAKPELMDDRATPPKSAPRVTEAAKHVRRFLNEIAMYEPNRDQSR